MPTTMATHWIEAAHNLAEWAEQRLVNWADRYCYYTDEGMRTSKTTPLTTGRLVQHFRVRDGRVGLVSLHSVNPDTATAKWVGIDIDDHQQAGGATEVAFTVAERARSMGLYPLVLDSDGHGSFHILLFLSSPVQVGAAWGLGRILTEGYRSCVEIFPHAPACTDNVLPRALRVPGRHHTNDHWTAVIDGLGVCLEGGEAVESLLTAQVSDVSQIPDEARDAATTALRKRERRMPPVSVAVGADRVVSRNTLDFIRYGAAEGERNRRLFAAACDLCGLGLGENEVHGKLYAVAHACGMADNEIRGSIQSAFKKPRVPARPLTGSAFDHAAAVRAAM